MSLYVDIKKNFGHFTLNMKFEAKNEILSLLGASGCGKSISLKCIAGIEKPDEGVIILDGVTLFDSKKKINLSPQERNVGLLFQNYALFPNMTVEENIAVGLRNSNDNKAEALDKLLATYFINDIRKLYPSQISGGQQQRVALARMLATNPKILMLDEPFSALDSHLRWQLEQELGKILNEYKQHNTVIYVSHNRDEVYRLCDKIAVVNNGQIDIAEEKWNLFNNPTTYSAALLTGCKNISKAQKKDEHTILATDWDLEFQVNTEIPVNIQYVGFRAHNLMVSDNQNTVNAFEYEIIHETEDTFNIILLIKKKGSTSDSFIRWEIAKEKYTSIKNNKKCICIDKNNVFLLI